MRSWVGYHHYSKTIYIEEKDMKCQSKRTKMSISKSFSFLCLALLLAFSSTIQAFNITRLLGQYPEFGLFNQYITETGLAPQVNGRLTITVLAVENSSLSSISGRPKDSIKAIISTHVLLDYYDERKLINLRGGSAQLTTLYQASGIAISLQGFILVAALGDGQFAFGSAVHGAPLNSQFVRTVRTQPFNISVLQVSQPIIPPGIDASSPWPPPGAKTPLPSRKPSPPSSDDDSSAESPVEADAPDSTVEAEAPAAPAPAPVPAPAPAPSPMAADEEAADEEERAPNKAVSAVTSQIGIVGAIMGLAWLLF